MSIKEHVKKPENLLLAMAFIMPLIFSVWMVLLNNFVIEKASFTGKEIGILQSLREIPGFLAFTVIYILLFIKEQKLAIVSLAVTAIGVIITGLFPSVIGGCPAHSGGRTATRQCCSGLDARLRARCPYRLLARRCRGFACHSV